MTAEIQAAKARLTQLGDFAEAMAEQGKGTSLGDEYAKSATQYRSILAELSRLEGIAKPNAVSFEAFADQEQRAWQAEQALADARRQIAERDEALKDIVRMADEAVNTGGRVTIQRCEDIADTARALLASSEPAVGEKA